VLDGRNRLEAMERAGIALRPCDREVFLGDAAPYILSKNVYRRHFRTKLEQAKAIVDILKAAERIKADAEKPCNPCTVSHKGGRGKVNPIKQKALAAGEQAKIGDRTMQKALAMGEDRKPQKPKRHRRTGAELERDTFLGFTRKLEYFVPEVSDASLDLLSTEEVADAIECIQSAMARMKNIVDRLETKDREA